MLLPAFLATASPVMVQDMHQYTKSIKITTYPIMDKLNTSDVPVYYCKIRYKRKVLHKAATSRKQPCFQISQSPHDPSLLFPFLCEKETGTLIHQSKVLFIMRGLSGSGKSTIVRAITSAYPSSVVCSADDYFLRNGVYKFDAACLGSAHEACQQKAKVVCSAGVPVVIVDNTNVRRWEMKFYLELASRTDYVVVPVQPKTPWRLNPEELAVRNKHGVDIETLRRKVKQFDDVIPLYYAWFLPEAVSKQLTSIAQCLVEECAQTFPGFRDRLRKRLRVSLQEETQQQQAHQFAADGGGTTGLFRQYYSSGNKSGSMVHCTAKFCGGGRAMGAKSYHTLPLVQTSVGRCFTLHIHSLCFSPRTVGARVALTTHQLPLFHKPEEKDWTGVQPPLAPANAHGAGAAARGRNTSQGSGRQSKGTKKRAASSQQENTDVPADHDSPAILVKWMAPRNTKPLAKGYGRSAHITIACAHGIGSRETNFDVLRMCDLEAGSGVADTDFVSVTGGKARYFGDGVCCVYFDPPLSVRTLYSGFY